MKRRNKDKLHCIMNSIASSSLLHFTKRFSALKGILSKGFRYSYCTEKFPKAVVNNVLHRDEEGFTPNNTYTNDTISGDVLIPMVSFCDVPLTRAGIHTNSYGKYIIGIDKEIARSIYSTLMPVQYMSSERYRHAVSELSMLKCSDLARKNQQVDDSINMILSSSKQYEIIRKGKPVTCYNEREWRIVLADRGETKWGWKLEAGESKEKYNKDLHSIDDIYLSFVHNDGSKSLEIIESDLSKLITHIIVKKESQVERLVDYIMNESNKIFGYNVSQCVRKQLISKISSFERLSSDY